MAQGFQAIEAAGRGGEPGVDAGQGAAVGFVRALGRFVGGGRGKAFEFRRDAHEQLGKGEFAAQGVDFGKIKVKDGRRLEAQGFLQDVGGDEGVAVPVAADPAPHPQEGRQRPGLAWIGGLQAVAGLDVELGQFGEEGAGEIADAVFNLVDDLEADRAQHAGLPQSEDRAVEAGVVFRLLLRGELLAVPLVEQALDFPLVLQHALALHLGGVGGEDRRDEGVGEKVGHRLGIDPGFGEALQGVVQAAFPGRGVGQVVGAAPPDVVLVLGDVGEVGEEAEGAHHHVGAFARQRAQPGLHLVARRRIAVAMEAQGEAADLLDAGEQVLALLLAHGVAEQAPEQADVLPQGLVLVGGFGAWGGTCVHGRIITAAQPRTITVFDRVDQ